MHVPFIEELAEHKSIIVSYILTSCCSHCQTLEVLHEYLETDVVGEDCLAWCCGTIAASAGVCGTWVELGEQETCLRASLVTDDVSWDRETVLEQLLSIDNGCLQQLLEVGIVFLFLVVCLTPLRNGLSVEDKDVEEGVKKEDDVGADGDRVEQNWMRVLVKCVAHQCWLDHDERVVDISLVENMAVECCLIWRVVEYLQELRATEVEHELRVDGKVGAELEARWVLLAVVGELLAQSDEHPVQPTKDIGGIVDLCLEGSDTSHEHCGGLLVELRCDVGVTSLVECARDGRDAETVLTRCVLVVGDKLNQTWLVGLQWLPSRGNNLKVTRQ